MHIFVLSDVIYTGAQFIDGGHSTESQFDYLDLVYIFHVVCLKNRKITTSCTQPCFPALLDRCLSMLLLWSLRVNCIGLADLNVMCETMCTRHLDPGKAFMIGGDQYTTTKW